jgi:hypothetical protein
MTVLIVVFFYSTILIIPVISDYIETQRLEGIVRIYSPKYKNSYIVIDKSDRMLYYISKKEQFSFPVSFGKIIGKKQKRGDNKTPEGIYYVYGMHLSKIDNYWFVTISYPNIEDAKIGFKSKLITERQYNLIVQSNIKKNVPPQNTPLGGAIGIHGRTRHYFEGNWLNSKEEFDNQVSELKDVSNGCIIAYNWSMDLLVQHLKKNKNHKIPVIIRS